MIIENSAQARGAGSGGLTDIEAWVLTDDVSTRNTFYTGMAFYEINATSKITTYTIPLTKGTGATTEGAAYLNNTGASASNDNLNVSVADGSIAGAGLSDPNGATDNFDDSNIYTIKGTVSQSAGNGATDLKYTIDGGTMTVSKVDNFLAQDYIAVATQIAASSGYTSLAVPGSVNMNGAGNDVISSTGGQLQLQDQSCAVSPTFTGISISAAALTACIQKTCDYTTVAEGQSITNVRADMLKHMIGG